MEEVAARWLLFEALGCLRMAAANSSMFAEAWSWSEPDQVSCPADIAARSIRTHPRGPETGRESEPDSKNGIVLAPYGTSYPPVMGANPNL
jgi:hypothetical protein